MIVSHITRTLILLLLFASIASLIFLQPPLQEERQERPINSSVIEPISPAAKQPYVELPEQSDTALQALLDRSVKAHELTDYIDKNELSITLVDITNINAPKLAHVNGGVSFYAASLPKLAILLAVFEEVHQNNLELTPEIDAALVNMIRNSSNIDATVLYELVGAQRIAEILESDRYRLYDRNSGGGLWVGKPYGKEPAWKRDPLTNFSHAATGFQVARFYYMLQRNELTDPTYCPIIKEILSDSAIEHKFVKGLKAENPTADIYRKSGTWRNYHSDSAIIESANGHQYIAVALSHTPNGSDVLVEVIKYLDRIVEEYHSIES